MGRLDRFLRLEKSRPRRAGPEPVLGAGGRFAGGDRPDGVAQAGPPAGSGAEMGRFQAAPPPDERAIGVLPDDGGQPFIRCRNCRTDNHVTAQQCSLCEASLTTPPQRAYNEALWQRQTAEKADLARHVEALAASQREASEEALQAIRRSRVFELETLDRSREPTLGVRLARRIRDPRVRLAVLIAAGVVPLYLLIFGGANGRLIGAFLCLVIGFLFSPPILGGWMRGGPPPGR